jgi:hypothetical protein
MYASLLYIHEEELDKLVVVLFSSEFLGRCFWRYFSCVSWCMKHVFSLTNLLNLLTLVQLFIARLEIARWQPDGETGVETRVIGTFG